jgi:hypothetical protein
VENWRGKRAWEKCRRELTAKGAMLDWKSLVPPPVPDDQNIFKAPHMAEWFVKDSGTTGATNQLSLKLTEARHCLARRSTNLIARIRTVPLGTEIAPRTADIVIPDAFETTGEVPAELRQKVADALQRSLAVSNNPASLQGAKGYRLFGQGSPPGKPICVVLFVSGSTASEKILSLFPSSAIPPLYGSNATASVVSSGSGAFEVHLRHPNAFAVTDYLDCTEVFKPEFDLIREALKRPIARMDGDYANLDSMPISSFVAIRDVAQTLSQRAQSYLLLGRPEEALKELILLHELGRLLEHKPPTLVAAMIHVAITGLYTSTVADGLRLRVWREPQLEALQQQLGEIQLLRIVMQSVESERAASCHLLETVSGSELTRIFGSADPKRSFWRKAIDPEDWLLRLMPRGWMYQNMVTIATTDQAFLDTTDKGYQRVHPRRADEIGVATMNRLSRFRPYRFMAAAAMPNFLKALQTTAFRQTQVEEALLACALERYHLAHADYPERLSALGPQLVRGVPTGVVNGQPFQYRRLEREHFLLYSFGWNETDDGGVVGKTTSEGDWVWQQ